MLLQQPVVAHTVADIGERPGGPAFPPIILGEKKKTERTKAGLASKIELGPLLTQSWIRH